MRRQGDEVEVLGIVVWPHVEWTVGGELGGVDEDPPAGGVHLAGEPVDRLHHAGDVGRAGHGEQGDAAGVPAQAVVEVVLVQAALGTRPHVDRAGAGPPRQIVGVVLEQRRQHDVAIVDRHGLGELVDRVRGVLGEQHHVAVGVGADELADDLARRLVRLGADPRLVTAPPVDPRVVREEALDRLHHGDERRCAGGVVEVDMGRQSPVEQRHRLIDPDEHRTHSPHGSTVWRQPGGR